MTHEELYQMARGGDQDALWTLCTDYRALFISESRQYATAMGDIMEAEDWISIGNILVWDIVQKGNFTGEGWGGYLKKAVRWRFTKEYERHVRRGNMVIGFEAVHEPGDESFFERNFGAGFSDRGYTISQKAEGYREKERERQERYYRKKAARIDAERAAQGLPPVYRKKYATEAEKAAHAAEVKERQMERIRQYQKEHADEIKVRKAAYFQKNRERYRLNDAIRRAKASIEKWTAKGNEKKAAKARERLAKYEAEREKLLGKAS